MHPTAATEDMCSVVAADRLRAATTCNICTRFLKRTTCALHASNHNTSTHASLYLCASCQYMYVASYGNRTHLSSCGDTRHLILQQQAPCLLLQQQATTALLVQLAILRNCCQESTYHLKDGGLDRYKREVERIAWTRN